MQPLPKLARMNDTDTSAITPGAFVQNTHIVHGDFEGRDLRGVDFTGSLLVGANFINADLTGAIFRDTELRDSDFHGAQLDRADFTDADLRGAFLAGSVIGRTTFDCAVIDMETSLPEGFDNEETLQAEGISFADEDEDFQWDSRSLDDLLWSLNR